MNYLEVKIKDIESNVRKLENYLVDKKTKKSPKIIAVVKCNMYGFGMEKFAKQLSILGIKDFAVSSFNEAIDLRNSGIDDNIYLLTPNFNKKELTTLIQNNIIITIDSEKQLDIIDEISREIKKNVKVNVKIDTGFSRYGILWSNEDEILDIYKLLDSLKNIEVVSTFSHFAQSFSDDQFTNLQFQRFLGVKKLLDENDLKYGFLHIANSNAILKSSKYNLDAVRLGSILLGRVIVKNNLELKRLGTLKVEIEKIKQLPKDSYIGYSKTYKTKRPTSIAILPIGHCDGVFLDSTCDCFRTSDKIRNFKKAFFNIFKKQKLYVKINEKRYDILGKIRTRFIIVDITDSDVCQGDVAIINCSYNYISENIQRRYI